FTFNFFSLLFCYHRDLHSFLHDALPISSSICLRATVDACFLPSRSFASCASTASETPLAPRHTQVAQVPPPMTVIRPRTMRMIIDRKSTRLNSSHLVISYAVFCLKKKNQ